MQIEKKPRSLKKFFIMLAIWFLTIVSIYVGSRIYEDNQGNQYTDTAVPFTKQVVTEISKWDPEITKKLMSPEILATIPEDRFVRAMTWFSKLGALQEMEEPEFEKLYIGEKTEIGAQTLIEYTVAAKYENGEALINIKLRDKDDGFDVYRFNLRSSTLTEE
jgi:hypothetical protein